MTTIDINSISVTPTSLTTVDVSISKSGMTQEPTSYVIAYQKRNDENINIGSLQTETFNVTNTTDEPVYEITNLSPGYWYVFTVTAHRNSTVGNSKIAKVRMPEASFNGKVISGDIDAKALSTAKSFFTITAPDKKNQFAVATKQFDAINIASSTAGTISSGYWYVDEYFASYSTKYYAFGTSLFMDNILTSPRQGAGLGFFTNSEGTKGYFIIIETTALSASQDRKSIRVVKADGSKLFKLKDSQKSAASTFDGIYGGVQYNIDVKVKISNTRVDMIIYINGFKITVSDELSYDDTKGGANYIVAPTQNVSLLCSSGTAAFDYVYGMDIDEPIYTSSESVSNFYNGQFSNDLLNTSFGDLVYSGNYGQDVYQTKKKNIEEFGTTVREIHKANIKFSSRPTFPIKWSTGNNRFAKIIGSKISNFGGEAYVLNNSSVTIPLSDNNMASFYVVGNTLSPSGELEYSTDEQSIYTTKEPITFQSKWLQSLADVKSLANWIKTNVVNKGKVINMEVFGNPLINVGDIISINYPYQGLDGTEKFIITNVNHSYNEGLTTSISCRLIVN